MSVPRVVSASALTFAPRFAYGDMCAVAEITGSGDGTKLGTGLARMHAAEIPWTVQYDEMLVVLEGAVTVRTAQGDLQAKAHDFVWLPKGTALTYIAEDALIFYAIHPVDWNDT